MTFEEIARSFLEACSKDFDAESSVKGEIIKGSGGVESYTLLTPDHIQFAKYGRGPGKKPPLDGILEWVSKEGITFDGTDTRGTAFAIQNSISINGTLGHTKNAPDFVLDTVNKYQKEYEKELTEHIRVEVSDRVFQAVEKIWEEEDKLFKKFEA
jgi:hypothetical protein